MDTTTEQSLKKLNVERTWATELIAAVGQFLDKAQNARCSKLKASCDELITCGLAMITHHTRQIAELRAADAEVAPQERKPTVDLARLPSQMHARQSPAPSVVAGWNAAQDARRRA